MYIVFIYFSHKWQLIEENDLNAAVLHDTYVHVHVWSQFKKKSNKAQDTITFTSN